MTIEQALLQAITRLEATTIVSARLDAELLMARVTNHDRAWILAHGDKDLTAEQASQFDALVTRRAAREPLVHLTGTREFYGLDMAITPDVLTPRVETEQMVEWAIKYAPQQSSLIDIGTGSGAIAIAIANHRPDLQITATEISPAAQTVARQNAKMHNAKINFTHSDLWTHVESRFDTIVTNLPYLRDDARDELMEEVKHEPPVALFGGADGLELYRRFLAGVPDHLSPNGYLFTECDPWQHESLIAEAAKYGLKPIEQGYFILGFQHI
jgi:release factor glutamine methyltransferase